jgi:hypothetical protein
MLVRYVDVIVLCFVLYSMDIIIRISTFFSFINVDMKVIHFGNLLSKQVIPYSIRQLVVFLLCIVSDQEQIWGYRLVFQMVNLVFETIFNIINKTVILILARISALIILDSRVIIFL